MPVTKSVTYKGQEKTDTLDSKFRIEDGNNRMVLFDGVNYRMIIGILPDGTVGVAISKVGEDVFDAFAFVS